MSQAFNFQFLFDMFCNFCGVFTGSAARSVCDAYEIRLQGGYPVCGLLHLLISGIRLGRKHLK
jgi:hypothetical protein